MNFFMSKLNKIITILGLLLATTLSAVQMREEYSFPGLTGCLASLEASTQPVCPEVLLGEAIYQKDMNSVRFLTPKVDLSTATVGGVDLLTTALSYHSNNSRGGRMFIDQTWLDIAKFLLEQGANPNGFSSNDKIARPLLLSVTDNNYKMAELLLQAGANPNLENSMGLNALQLALRNDMPQMIHLLLSYGASLPANYTWSDLALFAKYSVKYFGGSIVRAALPALIALKCSKYINSR